MEIVIRKGTMDDIEAFISLLSDVREAMEHKEWFYLDPPEVVRDMMETGIMELWVALDGNRLAGALDILHPGLEEYNYGYDLGFDREQLMHVVNMDSAAVRPEYRGLGLQRRLLDMAEQKLRGRGETYLLCTIHPDNTFSLHNALKQGYTIRKTGPKYGSVRHFLSKKIF